MQKKGQLMIIIVAIIVAIVVIGGFAYFMIRDNSSGSTSNTQTNNYGINPSESDVNDANNAGNIVEITSSGFSPDTIFISAGDAVTFINKDRNEHWPASAIHPTHTAYPGSSAEKCGTEDEASTFDACRGLTEGQSYTFIFNEVGEWSYHDHLNPDWTGKVVVEPSQEQSSDMLNNDAAY